MYELRKQYGNFLAVKDVSFGVNQRECFGLLGVNGAGKSTTFRMMTGGEVPNHGVMYIGDKDIENNRKEVSFFTKTILLFRVLMQFKEECHIFFSFYFVKYIPRFL